MIEVLRSVDGYTITREQGRYTLTRDGSSVHVRWTRRGYRCDCGERTCEHRSTVKTVLITLSTPGFDSTIEPW